MLEPRRPRSIWSRLWLALLISLSFSLTDARGATTATPHIDLLDVSPSDQITSGTVLSIRVEGTAGGQASARIQGVARTLVLKEVQDGIYEGEYTVRTADKLPRNAAVVATLRIAKRSATRTLGGGLGLLGQPAVASGPVISRFVSTPITKLEPGVDLTFAVEGSPKAKVVVKLPGARRDIALEEVAEGRYEGSYTVRQADKLSPDARATAQLTLAGKTTESTLSYALTGAPSSAAGTSNTASEAMQALPLKITSHQPNATVPSGAVTVTGESLPGTAIDVSVIANATFAGLGLNQSLLKERIQTDAQGRFSFEFRPPVAVKGVRYDISLSAYKGARTGTATLSLTQKK